MKSLENSLVGVFDGSSAGILQARNTWVKAGADPTGIAEDFGFIRWSWMRKGEWEVTERLHSHWILLWKITAFKENNLLKTEWKLHCPWVDLPTQSIPKKRAGQRANPHGWGEVWGLLAVNPQHLPHLEPQGRLRAGLGAGNGSWSTGAARGQGSNHVCKSQVDVWMFSQPRNRVSPRARVKNTGRVTGWKRERVPSVVGLNSCKDGWFLTYLCPKHENKKQNKLRNTLRVMENDQSSGACLRNWFVEGVS